MTNGILYNIIASLIILVIIVGLIALILVLIWIVLELLRKIFDFSKALYLYRVYKQRQKDGGCRYCNSDVPIGYDGANDAISIEGEGNTHILSSDSWEIEISYCPKCGRPLNGGD